MEEKDPLTGRIIAGAFEVSNRLGHGFLEAVYQKALAHELELNGLRVEREVVFRIAYKGTDVGTYIADMVIDSQVIVELKAMAALGPAQVGQCLNYLKASGLKIALLLNFGQPRLEFKRIAL